MKRNVDLTENMMFSSNLIKLSPSVQKGLVITGNSQDREETRKLNAAISDSFCDCCGEYLKIIPWRQSSRLCKYCETQLFERFDDRCPWRKKSQDYLSEKCPWRAHIKNHISNTILNRNVESLFYIYKI